MRAADLVEVFGPRPEVTELSAERASSSKMAGFAIAAGAARQKGAAALVQVMPYIGGPYALSGLVLVARYDESASAEAYR